MILGRDVGIDLARVAGVVAVVAGHVWSSTGARDWVHAWHVPLFFVLSGMMWRRGGRSLLAEVRHGVRRLLVPYTAWILIVLSAMLALGREAPPASHALMGGALLGRPFSTFWFLTALFAALLLARGLERTPMVGVLTSLCALGAAYAAPEAVSLIPGALGVGAAALVFVLAGQHLWPWYASLKWRSAISTSVVVCSVPLVFGGWVRPLDLKHADFGLPGVGVLFAILVSFAIVDLSVTVSRRLPDLGPPASMLAVPALVVVLTHPVVLAALDTPSEGRALDFLLALLLPWSAALMLVRCRPLSSLLVGSVDVGLSRPNQRLVEDVGRVGQRRLGQERAGRSDI